MMFMFPCKDMSKMNTNNILQTQATKMKKKEIHDVLNRFTPKEDIDRYLY